jgi:hypothetical protein
MKLTIENTTQLITVDGVPARVWEGHTESGIPVHCLVTRIAVRNGHDVSQFERELEEQRAPSVEAAEAFPLRMVL